MADSEEDLHSDDSNVSDYSEATGEESLLTSTSGSDSDQDDDTDMNLSQDYVTSETVSLQSSQQQWQHDNKKPNFKEQIQFRKLTRYADNLLQNLELKQLEMEQARESLSMCNGGIVTIEETCSQINEDIKQAKDLNNISSLGLLEGKLNKSLKQLEMEKLKERKLEENLREKEITLAEYELKASQCEDIQQELEEMESTIKQYKQKKAMFRAQGETRQLIEAQRLEDKIRKEFDKERVKKISPDRKKGMKIVNDAMKKRKEKEIIEEKERNEITEKRMKILLSLKKSVTESKETLKAKQLLEKGRQQKLREMEEEIKMEAMKVGGNPQELLLRSKKIEQYEKMKREFIKKQQQRQLSIVSKLVEEERIQKKEEERLKLSHWQYQYDDTAVSVQSSKKNLKMTSKRKPVMQLQSGQTDGGEDPDGCVKSDDVKKDIDGGDKEEAGVEKKEEEIESVNTDEDNVLLLVPDIPGLWQDKEPAAIATTTKMSIMEKNILDRTLNRLQANMTTKQIAAGREFKGEAFISKPTEIVFKDFEIGKMYKKRVQLTNVSYTVNYCKLIGVSDCLKDFIDVIFNPSGPVSAGLTCSMTVHFQPKINTDLSGRIELLSQTGPVYISLKCFTKRCVISVDTNAISFGSVCIGETIKRILTVSNGGALSTRLTIVPVTSVMTSEQPDLSLQDVQSDALQCGRLSRLDDVSHVSMLSAIEIKQTEGLLRLDQFNELQTRSTSDINDYDNSKPLDITPIKSRPQSKTGVLKEPSTKTITGSHIESMKEPSTKTINGSHIESMKEPSTNHLQSNNKSSTVNIQDNVVAVIVDEQDGRSEKNEEYDSQVTDCDSIEPLATISAAEYIKLGLLSTDVIEGYSTVMIELLFSPKLPGDYELDFKLQCYDYHLKQPIIISTSGKGIAVPVYVEKEVYDLKICLTDMMYQDSIVLHNRSVTPHNLTFTIPESLNRYINISPRYGLIQGHSSFAAQLKLQPTKELFDTEYIDTDTGVLRAPIDINIMNQTDPVSFIVRACITISDIHVSPSVINYGTCTIYESLVCTINVTNNSCLPMDFGFVQLPKWIAVQPNEGFGTLLPHETLPVDIIFNPDKPNTYSTKLTCKTAINKDVHLTVKGIGVLPGLSLSHSHINFPATPYGTTSMARLTIMNPRLSHMDSAVIRGEAPPIGRKMFEFQVPDDVPIMISPHVGSVDTGKSVEVSVVFSPVISADQINTEKMRLVQEMEKEEKDEPAITIPIDQIQKSQTGKGSLKSGSKGSVASSNNIQTGSQNINTEEKSRIDPQQQSSEWWWKAYNKLLIESENSCHQWTIPCYISYGDNITAARTEETLYVCITAPSTRPSLVIESDTGSNIIDYNTVAIGDKLSKRVILKNISQDTLKLSLSPLTSDGTFEIKNAMRPINRNSSHSMMIQFAPNISGKWYEALKIYYNQSSYMELILKGEGVDPNIKINLDEGSAFDYGHVMSVDKRSKSIELCNPSKLAVCYSIILDSSKDDQKYVKNCNGQCPFNCVPFNGSLLPESSVVVTVEFSPDHPGRCYSDKLHIDINSKVIQTIDMSGCVWPSNMFILGGIETQSLILSMEAQTLAITSPPVLLLMTHSIGSISSSVQFDVGCIKTGLVRKTSGEFVIEPLQGASSKSFTIDPIKSSVEAGGSRTVTITFTAPQQIKDKVIESNSFINLKCDTPSRHQLLIRVTITD